MTAPGPAEAGGLDAAAYSPPDGQVLKRRLQAADRPGEHLWVITAAWQLADPRAARDGTVIFDDENMIQIAGPGCFKCEQEFSNRLARRPCRGSVDELQH